MFHDKSWVHAMRIIEKYETTSTNTDAIELAQKGADNFTVVWSHSQTAGRGRHNRKWDSISGNVFWSIIVRPQEDWPSFVDLVFVNALAVRNSISQEIRNSNKLWMKWPNDIIINNFKIAGSLLETSGIANGTQPEWVVIGTGINVTNHPDGEGMLYPPNSLHGLGFKEATRDSLIQRLNVELPRQIDLWREFGFGKILDDYRQASFKIGQKITVGFGYDKSTYQSGIYEGVNERGELLL
ncbi:biotin--[acetyl-CoA-carboxylase] ligase [Azospirillum sp. B506]|uniref:biotin--[acetyl-CoA-carboxylase] ligase n=1 Tax=Azospirillum sp. B506 TaxID=137721 RepID=UPI000A067BFF|nr:biotin--[acetyl-CoA-carboxylase] ligase [Azospirillum sp. B506]